MDLGSVYLLIILLSSSVFKEISSNEWKKWCGKNYEYGSPVEEPGGKFEGSKDEDKRKIRCTPTLKPFVGSDPINIIIDLKDKPTNDGLMVKIIDRETDRELMSIRVNETSTIVGPLKIGSTRIKPYKLECKTLDPTSPGSSHPFQVKLLPDPSKNFVQLDSRSGFFNVFNNQNRKSHTFFPYGFYTGFGDYLNSTKLSSIIESMKDRRINTVHIVPDSPYIKDFSNLKRILSSLNDAGIYIQYDMRHSYKNLTMVDIQLKEIIDEPNLLTWYTADEPDGQGDDSDLVRITSSHLNEIDPYHPVALVLNCEDYHFSEYTTGTDVIMTDPYMIAQKSSVFADKWKTACNSTYGDCGCDNCEGNFKDLTNRMESFRNRRSLLGRSRSMQIWGVPQAFKDDSYWTRPPTGVEFLLSCSLYVVEGAAGLMGWIENFEMSDELRQATKTFGIGLEKITKFLIVENDNLNRRPISKNGGSLKIRKWKHSESNSILIISTNLETFTQDWSIDLKFESSSSDQIYEIDEDQKEDIVEVEKIFESNVLESFRIKEGDGLNERVGSGKLLGLGCSAYVLKFSEKKNGLNNFFFFQK